MILSKEALARINKLIDREYKTLLMSVVGPEAFTAEELEALEAFGIDTSDRTSLLEMIFYNNIINEPHSDKAPKTIEGMELQQQSVARLDSHNHALDHANSAFSASVRKIASDLAATVEGLARDANNVAVRQGGPAEGATEELMGRLQKVLERSEKDFHRTAVTEVAEAVGAGSIERVMMQNEGHEPEDVLVYRIAIDDNRICKYCRDFYLDHDGTPAVYRLSTLLANGSNFGKTAKDWKPVVGVNHPHDRETGIIQLKPGWQVGTGGLLNFVGFSSWDSYAAKKTRG